MTTKTPDIETVKRRLASATMHAGVNTIVERDDIDALLEYVERLEKERDDAHQEGVYLGQEAQWLLQQDANRGE